jgi:hypothetical protein
MAILRELIDDYSTSDITIDKHLISVHHAANVSDQIRSCASLIARSLNPRHQIRTRSTNCAAT